MAEIRLQKFLAQCGVGSRRKMEEFITTGRVRVNGQVVTKLGRKIDPDLDRVEVNRRPIQVAPRGILLLHKPRGVISSMSDPEGRRTVADYLTKHQSSYFPVGRLDWDSTGLMILTNDGELAERLMHPRFGCERVYKARVEGSVPESVLDKLARGVKLTDGVVTAEAEILSNDEKSTWLSVRIREGRNRIVRRVFEKLGYPVMKLKRTEYGPCALGKLGVGEVRTVSQKEYLRIRRAVFAQTELAGAGAQEQRDAGNGRAEGGAARGAERGAAKRGARVRSERGSRGSRAGRPGRPASAARVRRAPRRSTRRR